MASLAIRGLTATTDLLPPRLRFGRWQHQVLARLAVPGGLPVVARSPGPKADSPAAVQAIAKPDLNCMIVAGALDGGGVESVISALARGLPSHNIDVTVVCTQWGRVSSELRDAGVSVVETQPDTLSSCIEAARPDIVQLHRPDRVLIAETLRSGVPVVPVLHAIEAYLNRATWDALAGLIERAPVTVAVSDGVKVFFEQRLGLDKSVRVILNGVPPIPPHLTGNRAEARLAVGEAVRARIQDSDILVVALQRFSDQKNAAGVVDGFLAAIEADQRLRLVLAGSPDNWLEVRRADFLRRSSPNVERVHLLGDSDPWRILMAGDVYMLDSFAEGGPLTAVEAALCGLPLVLSDVGFARELIDSDGVRGEVVIRANEDYSQSSMATQRRKRHQSNRQELAAALNRVVNELGPRGVGRLPDRFTDEAMVRAHAAVLRSAVRQPA